MGGSIGPPSVLRSFVRSQSFGRGTYRSHCHPANVVNSWLFTGRCYLCVCVCVGRFREALVQGGRKTPTKKKKKTRKKRARSLHYCGRDLPPLTPATVRDRTPRLKCNVPWFRGVHLPTLSFPVPVYTRFVWCMQWLSVKEMGGRPSFIKPTTRGCSFARRSSLPWSGSIFGGRSVGKPYPTVPLLP